MRLPCIKVKVLGHDAPDPDTAISTLLMTRLLRALGYDAEPVRTGWLCEKGFRLLSGYGIDYAGWTDITEPSDALFLVDCHETSRPGRVIGVVDHHPTKDTPPAEVYINGPYSSAALRIYRLMLEEGVRPTDEEELLTLCSIYFDTQALLSTKFDPNDRPLIDSLIKKHGLKEDALIELGLTLADMSLPAEELSGDGLKYYSICGLRVASTQIQARRISDSLRKAAIEHINKRRNDEGVDLWLLILSEPLTPSTEVIEIYDGRVEATSYPRFLSRSMDIIPQISEKLAEGS